MTAKKEGAKRGRPPLPDGVKLSERVAFKVKRAEMVKLELWAHRNGMTVSAYVRRILFD